MTTLFPLPLLLACQGSADHQQSLQSEMEICSDFFAEDYFALI